MGDGGGNAALDEMSRMVARMLAELPAERPAAGRPAIADGALEVPAAADLDRRLGEAAAAWADWRRRLTAATATT